uniref:DExH-box ATP-dependent RNA helicase DExH14 n=1 Tax=Tanacetum cinerariifolium TaxID=118510 RepID=A0A699HKT1_TANCI|nr:DExH-box ATP-dependent RNA helicase DExH14 [Tanacetum cinerariifolium]
MESVFELNSGSRITRLWIVKYCKAADGQIWPDQHPLRQFDKDISLEILLKLEEDIDLNHLQYIQKKDIGTMICYAPGGR